MRRYAFPAEVFTDAETFFRWGPLYALATDLSAMFAITPSMVLQFAQRIEAQRDDGVRAERDPGQVPAQRAPASRQMR